MMKKIRKWLHRKLNNKTFEIKYLGVIKITGGYLHIWKGPGNAGLYKLRTFFRLYKVPSTFSVTNIDRPVSVTFLTKPEPTAFKSSEWRTKAIEEAKKDNIVGCVEAIARFYYSK